jgi:hypothetical protein
MKTLLLAAFAALLAFSPGLAQERGHHGGGFGGGFERGGARFGGPAFAPGGRGPVGFGGFPAPRARAAPRYQGAPYSAQTAGGYALEPREGFAAPRTAAPYGGGGAYGGFRRGQFLPQGYWGGAVADPRAYHLRRPPNGYSWVTVGPNAYLMQRSTGLILDTAPLY